MNPLTLFVLYTVATSASGTGCRAYLFADQAAAQAAGERLVAAKPSEVTSLTFMVLPLEGAPS